MNGAFGAAIGKRASAKRCLSGIRADVDDRPALPVREHPRHGGANAEEIAGHVDGEHAFPILERNLVRRRAPRKVKWNIDENIDTAQDTVGRGEKLLDLCCLRDVAQFGCGQCAKRRQLLRGPGEPFGIDVADQEIRPGVRETTRDRVADAAIRARTCNDGRAPRQAEQCACRHAGSSRSSMRPVAPSMVDRHSLSQDRRRPGEDNGRNAALPRLAGGMREHAAHLDNKPRRHSQQRRETEIGGVCDDDFVASHLPPPPRLVAGVVQQPYSP